ncbi:MAG: hypothetical protein WCT14_17860 [Treponemataceae bacterium]
MSSVALRHRLFYDPLFLDLHRRLVAGYFGRIAGGGSSAVVSSTQDLFQLCAFFVLFFGVPQKSHFFSDRAASLDKILLLYDNYALSLDAVLAPKAVPPSTGIALTGSLSCSRALVEFRFGAERLSAYAPSEETRYRLAFPEGDGALYKKMDEAYPDAKRLISRERDHAAVAFAEEVLGTRFDSFTEIGL